jgi:3-methyladenine DNA glycosylase/8-oxoguanine DNA glycosylase
MLEEMYVEFQKFSRAEVLHFRKLGQQRKATIENESSRPLKYSKDKEDIPNFDAPHKQVHRLTRMDVDLQKIGSKFSGLHDKKARAKYMTPGEIISKPVVATQAEAKAGVKIKNDLFIACSTRKIPIIGQGIVLFS